VAREYEVAIPHELSQSQRTQLVRGFSEYLANRYTVGVDFAIHKAHRDGDQRNHHAHVLTTTREVTATGLGAKTALELSETERARRGMPHSREEFVQIRSRWAELSNEQLKRHGHEAHVDHRTLAAQGIDRAATVHLGPAVIGLMRRGKDSTVERRVAWQEQQAALARLEVAKRAGVLERERQPGGLLYWGTDVLAARSARDTLKAIDLAQMKSGEAWVAYRTNRELTKSKEGMPPPEPALPSLVSRTPKASVKSIIELDRDGGGLEH
jgi:MobA/MobL family